MKKLEGEVKEILGLAGSVIADKGFQGSGYVTPAKKPKDRELYMREHEYNNQVSSIRAPIERAVAHLKTYATALLRVRADDQRRARCRPRPFTLVSFGPTDNAKMRDSRPMASHGRAGHPRNAVWFCTDHLALARQHQDIDTGAALRAIDTVIGRKPRPERGGDSAASPST